MTTTREDLARLRSISTVMEVNLSTVETMYGSVGISDDIPRFMWSLRYVGGHTGILKMSDDENIRWVKNDKSF